MTDMVMPLSYQAPQDLAAFATALNYTLQPDESTQVAFAGVQTDVHSVAASHGGILLHVRELADILTMNS